MLGLSGTGGGAIASAKESVPIYALLTRHAWQCLCHACLSTCLFTLLFLLIRQC